jgi:hypothetical protein
MRSRVAAEPRLRAGISKGRALAQRGELQRHARLQLAERRVSLERERQPAVSGARLGSARAAAYRRDRERRAIELGLTDLAAHYQRRYSDERRRLDELAVELSCAESAVRGDLQRLGLGPDRTRSHGARWQQSR